jgi:hypothetical protein
MNRPRGKPSWTRPAALTLMIANPFTLAVAQALPTRAPEVTVQITATAATRDAALAQAVSLGVDAVLARVITPGTSLAEQARQKLPDRLARVVRIVSERSTPQGVTVTVQVAFPGGVAERVVLGLQPQLSATRVAVLIPESILRRPVPDPAAETELARALIDAGLKVVDLAQSLRLAERERLRSGSLTDEEVAALRARLGVDVLVTGEAFAEEYGAVAGGTRAYTSRLEVRVIDLSSAQVLLSQAYHGSGIGATDAVAGKTALMNAGRLAGETLPGALVLALQGGGRTAPRTYTLRLTAPVTFGVVNALATRLKGQPDLQGVTVRALDTAGATLDLSYAGSVTDLAALLEASGLSVTSLNGLELTARF